MHTVQLLRDALDLAARAGYEIRQDWLGGSRGGACELKGRKLLVLDVALGPTDQLEAVLDALRVDPAVQRLPMPYQLRELLGVAELSTSDPRSRRTA